MKYYRKNTLFIQFDQKFDRSKFVFTIFKQGCQSWTEWLTIRSDQMHVHNCFFIGCALLLGALFLISFSFLLNLVIYNISPPPHKYIQNFFSQSLFSVGTLLTNLLKITFSLILYLFYYSHYFSKNKIT